MPKSGPGHFDQNSVGIRQALNVPKSTNLINDQIRGSHRDTVDGKFMLVSMPAHTDQMHNKFYICATNQIDVLRLKSVSVVLRSGG